MIATQLPPCPALAPHTHLLTVMCRLPLVEGVSGSESLSPTPRLNSRASMTYRGGAQRAQHAQQLSCGMGPVVTCSPGCSEDYAVSNLTSPQHNVLHDTATGHRVMQSLASP